MRILSLLLALVSVASAQPNETVVLAGEVTSSSAILHARTGQPGQEGAFVLEAEDEPERRVEVEVSDDGIARVAVRDLEAGTHYTYRFEDGRSTSRMGRFRTLHPGGTDRLRILIANCLNQARERTGRTDLWRSYWPPATGADSALGYPGLEAMLARAPDLVVAAGDNVYYDYAAPGFEVATDREGMQGVWDRQLSLPRFADLLAAAPVYWMKDDHDFRFNDADTTGDRPPSARLGVDVFREQVPVVDLEDESAVTYRTHRLNRNVQVWMVEGRDYRSPNAMSDGPDKSIWGETQAEWLRSTILASDAPVKILVHPTPLVGPDGSGKGDNHTNPGGFQYERDVFFAWLRENGLEDDLVVVTGDRHWQYHAVHPAGVQEFSVGALNDANSRYGVRPGEAGSTDPIGLIRQPYLQAPPSGGFLEIDVLEVGGAIEAQLTFVDDEGRETYRHVERREPISASRPGRFNLIPVWSRLADDAGAFDLEGDAGVQAVAMDAEGYLVATASRTGLNGPAVTLWTTPRGAAIWTRPSTSTGLSFSADGRHLAIGGATPTVVAVRGQDGEVTLEPSAPAPGVLEDALDDGVFEVAPGLSPDGVLIAAFDGHGVMVRGADGLEVARIAGATAPLAWTRDSRYLLTGAADGIRAFDRESDFALSATERVTAPTALGVGPDGTLVSGHTDGTVRLWDISAEPATP